MKVLYSKVTEKRNKEHQIYTLIVEENNKKYVIKKNVYIEGRKHIENMFYNYKLLNAMQEGLFVDCNKNDDGISFSYVDGKSWASSKLHSLISKEDYMLFFQEWKKILALNKENVTVFNNSEEFRKIFGDGSFYVGHEALKVTNFDCIPDNILESSDGTKIIDYEWVFDFPVPLELAWYRLVKYLYDNYQVKVPLQDLLAWAGIDNQFIDIYEFGIGNFEKWISADESNQINYIKLGDIFKKAGIIQASYFKDKKYMMPAIFQNGTMRAVVYGAGEVGQNWVHQNKEKKYFDVVAWVDKNFEKYVEKGYDVKPVNWVLNNDYDKIIIAVFDFTTAEQIKNELLLLGIDDSKILWEKPVIIKEM